jgi:type III secretion protein C
MKPFFLPMCRSALVSLLGGMILWSAARPVPAAPPEAWRDTAFSIDTHAMSVDQVLAEFASTYGVRVIGSVKTARRLGGRIKGENGIDFLNRLAATQQFRWFVFDNALYVGPVSDQVSMRLAIGEDAVLDAKAALTGLGLYDPRFGWGELPDEGIIMLSGPRAYVDLVKHYLTSAEKDETPVLKGRQIMVFRLKYANVMDRVITDRGQKETIPGIKTLLSNLLGPDFTDEKSVDLNSFSLASSKPSGHPKGGRDATAPVTETPRADPRAKPTGAKDRPRIDADASRNALIVYDDVGKRAMYANLVAELDVAPRQIEIEALIIDIDRNHLTELGVEWGVKSANVNTTMRVGGSTDSQGADVPLPGATLLINNAARFYARLKALEGDGTARVLARPTVVTLENVAAVIDLSQVAYVPLVGERVADLADIAVGTKLHVIPRVVQEGTQTRVRMEVDIEDGNLTGKGAETLVSKSTISTQAIIDLQQTLMIGGYHAETANAESKKVPVLGSIPLFGTLFRNDSKEHSTRERLFLITPRIAGGGSTAPASSKAAQRARILAERQLTLNVALDPPLRPAPAAQPEPAAAAPAPPPAPAPAVSTSQGPGALAATPDPARRGGRFKCGPARQRSYANAIF